MRPVWVALKSPPPLERGAGGLDEVGRTPDHRRDVALEGVHYPGPRPARGELLGLGGIEGGEHLFVAGLRLAAPRPVPLLGELRKIAAPSREALPPLVFELSATLAAVHVLVDLVGDGEMLVWVELHRFLGCPDFFLAQGRAVGGSGVDGVGGGVGDVGADYYQRRSLLLGDGVARRFFEGFEVLDVFYVLDVPAVGLEALGFVFGVEGDGGRTVDGDAVVVVEVDKLPQSVLPSDGGGLVGDALHQVPVGAYCVDAVVHDLVPDAVVPAGEETLGDGHPDPVGEALPQRSGRRLHARGVVSLGVPRRPRAPLPEVLQILHREVVAGEV